MLIGLFDDADTSDLVERDSFMAAGNWEVVVLRIGTFEAQGLYEHEESIPAEAARTERRGRHWSPSIHLTLYELRLPPP